MFFVCWKKKEEVMSIFPIHGSYWHSIFLCAKVLLVTGVLLQRNLFLYVLKCSVSFAQHETNTCKVQKCSGDFWCSNWKTKARGTGLKLKFRFRFSRNWCLIPSINKYLLVYLCCVVGLLWLTGSLNVFQHFIVWKYLVDYRNRNRPIMLIVGN